MASASFCKKLQDNPEVYLIVIPFANGPIESTNCYVVKDGEKALVVDVGAKSRRGLAVMTAALDEIGVDPARADYFITHLHLDHVGMLSALAGADSVVYVDEGDWASIPPLQRWCILGETMAYVQHLVAIGTIRETRQDQVGVLRLA